MSAIDLDDMGGDFRKAWMAFSESLSEYIGSNLPIRSKKPIEIPSIEDVSSASEKRDALKSVLLSMAETDPSSAMSDSDAKSLISFFKTLYGEDSSTSFRHMYSEVCEVMYGFLSDTENELDEGIPAKAVQLANSVGIVAIEMENRCSGSHACDGTRKLLDHINLEITRMRYMTEQNKAVMQAIRDNKESAERYEEKIRAIEDENRHLREDNEEQVRKLGDEVESRLKTLQKEYIAILGIFASIIIAFTSGMAFSSSVLQNIEKASIYRLSFVVLIVGMFIFLMVSALFVFLNRISGIKNDRMFHLLKRVAIAFVALIVAIVVARAFDILSFFPIPIPL